MSAGRLDASAESERRRAAADALAALSRDRHGELVRLVLARTEDDSRAEEGVQEVYRRVIQEPAGFLEAADKLAYLRAAVRREAAHIRVRAASERNALAALEREPLRTSPRTPEAERRTRVLEAAVRRSVASLPCRQGQAVTLVRLNGKTYKEAAAVMGCAQKTTENHLRRGLAALRRDARLARMARM